MADKAISALTEATVINDADRFVLEQSGQAKQISGATMISEFAEALDGHGGIQSIDLVGGEGNIKTYRITFTDGTTYDYEVRDGESGNYAVVAGNLAPYSDASGATQSIPFLSQGTGQGNGSATVSAGNYCQLKKKLGNTVAVNQLVGSLGSVGVTQNCTKSYNSGTGVATFTPTNYASDNVGVYGISSAIVGRKYIISMQIKLGKAANVRFAFGGNSETKAIAAGSYVLFQRIATATSTGSLAFYVECGSAGWSNETFEVKNLWGIDLTLWYGSNDRIPSDLLSHPENWGRYYAGSLDYNAGTLESADGTVMRSIGRNVWDEVWDIGDIDGITGEYKTGSYVRSKNHISVIPSAAYYFYAPGTLVMTEYDGDGNAILNNGNYSYHLVPAGSTYTMSANTRTIAFHTLTFQSYNHDITISLYYSGESGYDQYYPYSVLAEVDTGSEVLRSAGAVADEKTPDGTITRRVGVVDLGTLDYYTYSQMFIATLPNAKSQNYDSTNGRCAKYALKPSSAGWADMPDKSFGFSLTDVRIKDSAYSDAATFKTAMSGVYLYYELATPTTEQGTAFAENIPCNPVGSMSWENTNGIPQGAEIFYPYDYAGELDSMLGALPSANGTYTLKATVANGKITYSWVAG